MKRISVDNFGLTSSKKDDVFFPARRRRNGWYTSSPKLFTTLLCFIIWYCWSQLGGNKIEIPGDQFAYIEDSSLVDILNTTLGFEKILILNLPFRTDRRDAMTLSAATSNIHVEFLDGVTGESIKPSAYPPPLENQKLQAGIRGSWRTHMSALQTIVEQNLTTALIMEDDVDWDIRIRQNLQRFALASRFLSEEKSTLSSNPQYDIENRPNTETAETSFHILENKKIESTLPSLPLSSINFASNQPLSHSSSPYGNPTEWDILWIGHCGAGFPRSSSPEKNPPTTTANVILTQANDDTVPNSQHLKAHPFQDSLDPLASAYPPHTRIFHRATGGELCTVAYAVSQRGARRLLHQFGVKGWNGIFDSELGRWCAGEDPDMGPHARPPPSSGGKSVKAKERVCLTSQPPIFAHHHPQQGESDIGGLGGGYARRFETKYLRLSVRMNLERIVHGATERELVDQWPDEGGQVIP